MPILERDPWRYQYFEGVDCPDDVLIPTDDPDCWELYPRHRWVYDKLKVAESQGLASGPHGVSPKSFPVFSKPIVNLKGMGIGSRIIADAGDYDLNYRPGHMWMHLLTGAHVSIDCAVEDSRIVWSRAATGEAWNGGTFKQWTIEAAPRPLLEDYLAAWARKHMAGYSGMMNFETIGGRIIEVHLRFADQWCDLYGEGWVQSLVNLYKNGRWSFDDGVRRDAYSLPLFASHGKTPRHPDGQARAEILAMPGVASLQITYYENKDGADHPMPPGGFRLGIVNSTDLESGRKARLKLASCFPDTEIMWPD